MYYIYEDIEEEEIKTFLEKYGFIMPKSPDVPALKRESATRFIHAVRGSANQDIYALICGVSYERNIDFDVLMPINVGFDVYSILSKQYFAHYYQMNQVPNRLIWRLNGIIQRSPGSAEVVFPYDSASKLKQMLNI